jgi:hypothetical protein
LDRRIPNQETLKKEVTAWVNQRNDYSAMDWRFTTMPESNSEDFTHQ